MIIIPCSLESSGLTCASFIVYVVLNQMHYLPEEPFIEELGGDDGMEFPPPPDTPMEDEAVIPGRVIDELLDAPDEIIMMSLAAVR